MQREFGVEIRMGHFHPKKLTKQVGRRGFSGKARCKKKRRRNKKSAVWGKWREGSE
jgi:hypothetical protein